MNLNFEKSFMGVILTLALLFSCPLSGRLQNTEPIHASEQAQNSGQYDYSQLPWIMNLVSVTTYDGPAGNTQYAYHIVGKLESGPIEYNRVVGQFDNLKIEEKYSELQHSQDVFTLDTDGYTNGLLKDANGRAITLFVTYYLDDEIVLGPFSAVLPPLDRIPAGGTPLKFELVLNQQG
jgi:hypothetical protein